MRRVIQYLRAHPVVAAALAVGVVGVLVLVLTAPSPPPPAPAVRPLPVATPVAPSPTQPAVPAAQPAPAAAPPVPAVAAPVDAGRPDPFIPLVRAETGAGPDRAAPAPPPAPLPPPLFPGQAPAQPGVAPTPAPPPKEASTAALVGILGDDGGAAIIKVGDRTYIVSRGDVILDKIKVAVIDVVKRLVILEQDGERFELKMGGSHQHVAATAPSSIS